MGPGVRRDDGIVSVVAIYSLPGLKSSPGVAGRLRVGARAVRPAARRGNVRRVSLPLAAVAAGAGRCRRGRRYRHCPRCIPARSRGNIGAPGGYEAPTAANAANVFRAARRRHRRPTARPTTQPPGHTGRTISIRVTSK